jgi:hypothetical protein
MPDVSKTTALFLAQVAVSLSRPELRWEFANIAAAVALLSIAFAAIALFFFRRRTRDLTLIFFGLFCILYAVRLLALLPSFRSLFDEARMFWDYVNWVITCTITLPFGLFLYQVVSEQPQKVPPLASGRTSSLRGFRNPRRRVPSQHGQALRREQHRGARHVRGHCAVLGRQ